MAMEITHYNRHIHVANWTLYHVPGGWRAINFISGAETAKYEKLDALKRTCGLLGDEPIKKKPRKQIEEEKK